MLARLSWLTVFRRCTQPGVSLRSAYPCATDINAGGSDVDLPGAIHPPVHPGKHHVHGKGAASPLCGCCDDALLAVVQTCVRAKDAAEGNKLLFTLGRPCPCPSSISSCQYRDANSVRTDVVAYRLPGTQDFAEPGGGDFPLGGFVKPAQDKAEQKKWKDYFKDLRQELCKVRFSKSDASATALPRWWVGVFA